MTCYTFGTVILRPVMSMKLSQPGCVGSIEIYSIRSLHLIALFSYDFCCAFLDFYANVRWEVAIFPFLNPTRPFGLLQVGVNIYDLPVSAHDTGVELRGRLGQGLS